MFHLRRFICCIVISQRMFDLLFSTWTGDNKISLPEYIHRWTSVAPNMGTVASGIFSKFDFDQSGFLDQSDVDKGYALIDLNCKSVLHFSQLTTALSPQLLVSCSQVTGAQLLCFTLPLTTCLSARRIYPLDTKPPVGRIPCGWYNCNSRIPCHIL